MKPLFTVVLALAFLAMGSERFAGTMQAKASCAKAVHCCSHHSPDKPQTPAPVSCAQCCTACCAVVLETRVEVRVPAIGAIKLPRTDFGAPSRNDEPPVPPPRWS